MIGFFFLFKVISVTFGVITLAMWLLTVDESLCASVSHLCTADIDDTLGCDEMRIF